MKVLRASNVNDAWQLGCDLLNEEGKIRPSRYGEVIEHPEPVCTVYEYPDERFLFDQNRDCNPFFHLMEGLWMLAGRRDVAWISQFNSRMKTFSDNGLVFHGAYGYRWRNHFRDYAGDIHDQIQHVVELLKKDPDTRRAVIQMWDPAADLGNPEAKLDIPCNTAIYFKMRDGYLHMTVTNRSNDIVWGCYGANAVHMSMLHEVVAAKTGLELGTYRQISDSFHAYTNIWEEKRWKKPGYHPDPYELDEVHPFPMVDVSSEWDDDLDRFFETTDENAFVNPFFPKVAVPVYRSWIAYKAHRFNEAYTWIARCEASDVRRACGEWYQRHPGKNKTEKSDGGTV